MKLEELRELQRVAALPGETFHGGTQFESAMFRHREALLTVAEAAERVENDGSVEAYLALHAALEILRKI